jgi:hypothetical protein
MVNGRLILQHLSNKRLLSDYYIVTYWAQGEGEKYDPRDLIEKRKVRSNIKSILQADSVISDYEETGAETFYVRVRNPRKFLHRFNVNLHFASSGPEREAHQINATMEMDQIFVALRRIRHDAYVSVLFDYNEWGYDCLTDKEIKDLELEEIFSKFGIKRAY